MAGKSTFKMTGGRELDAALAEFAKPMAKAVVRRALRKAAEPVLAAYQARTKVVSGDLVESETIGTKLTRRQRRLARRLGRSEVEVHIGTSDPAGVQEEFGNVRQAPHPALRPAWDQEGGQRAVDRIGSELAADIDRTAARLAKRVKAGE